MDKWIAYPMAIYVLDRLEELLAHPAILRMPMILFTGKYNQGKTTVITKFEQSYQSSPRFRLENSQVPVLSIQTPIVPDEKQLYSLILEKLGAANRASDRVEGQRQLVSRLFRQIHLKVLILEDLQRIVTGSRMKQQIFLNVIKSVANEFQICLVGVGTSEVYTAIERDDQFINRFDPIGLATWQMNEE